jgi:hypothetical protein
LLKPFWSYRGVGERQRADAGAQRAVGTVARIHQHDATRDARRQRRAKLGQRDQRCIA